MFKGLNLSSTGMMAERMRLEIISSNIANANNTETINGKTYTRKQAVLSENQTGIKASSFEDVLNGVKVEKIVEDKKSEYRLVYEPEHPDAIKTGELQGYVKYPNVDITKEMMDLLNAQRGFEVNAKVFETSKDIINTSLTIGK